MLRDARNIARAKVRNGVAASQTAVRDAGMNCKPALKNHGNVRRSSKHVPLEELAERTYRVPQ